MDEENDISFLVMILPHSRHF